VQCRAEFSRAILFVSLVFLGMVCPGTILCRETVQQTAKELLLYELDVNDEHLLLKGRLPIDETLTIQQKLRILLDEISRRHFSDRPPIEILRTRKTKEGFVVTLNLREDGEDFYRSKWYQSFQGSTGGWWTFFQLVYTPLQPDYPGFWFSGVNVFWNGNPIEELDHIDLSGEKRRSEMRRICTVGDPC